MSLVFLKCLGGPGEIRTHDLFHAMEARSQLRHRPTLRVFYNISHASSTFEIDRPLFPLATMISMPVRRVLAATTVLTLIALGQSSCLVRRRTITRKGGKPSQTLLIADRDTLIQSVAKQFEAIRDFSATVDMTPALGTAEKSKITEYKDVRGYVRFRQPADIRLIGLYPVVRNKAFDMVSNGSDFKLYVPSRNRFI